VKIHQNVPFGSIPNAIISSKIRPLNAKIWFTLAQKPKKLNAKVGTRLRSIGSVGIPTKTDATVCQVCATLSRQTGFLGMSFRVDCHCQRTPENHPISD
jgi:hypothetical protein